MKTGNKNVTMKKEHLPIYGVGPIYVAVIIIFTVAGITLSALSYLPKIQFGVFRIPMCIFSIILILLGLLLWFKAVFKSKVDKHIKSNSLVTDGVYAVVRNPIYSAFLIICTGAILFANNLLLLILPPLFWLFLTILMKCTEEKWLKDLYGKEYDDYCKKTNRCIPWFKKHF